MEDKLLECEWDKCFLALTLGIVNKSDKCFPARSIYVSTNVRNIEKFASIFIPTMSLFGIICNILNIYVLSRFRIKSCFHRLLCYLAVFDILILFFGPFGDTHVLNIFQSKLNILCKTRNFQLLILTMKKIEYFMVHGSSWLTVGISLERFLGICYPLKYPVRLRKARYFLVPVVLMALLDTAILHYFFKDRFVLHTIPSHAFPILLIIFFNSNIFLALMKMKKQPGTHQENVTDGALILLGVVVAFTICWAPSLVKNIISEIFKTHQLEVIGVLEQVGYCTVIINSSMNFFIYCIVGKQYRQHFKAAFICSSSLPLPHVRGKANTNTNTKRKQFSVKNYFQASETTLPINEHPRILHMRMRIPVAIVL